MRYLLALWLCTVTAISLIPLHYKIRLGTKGEFHDWGHFTMFLITALLLCWGTTAWPRLLRCVCAAGFGILLEWTERLIYHHPAFEWRDVAVDCLGVLCGLIIVSTLSFRRFPEDA